MRFVGSLWIVCSLVALREAADTETISDTSLSPGLSTVTGQSGKVPSQGQYRCVEPSKRDAQENRTGLFCTRMWDGFLCWNETPAGESVTQKCPDHPDLGATEKVTKYCDKSGNWVQTGSTCRGALKSKIEEIYFLKDEAGEPTTEAMWDRTEKNILENENKCLEKMKNDPPFNKSGLHCSRNWDGWLCWDDTPAGNYASQNCPDYFVDFDHTEKATKYCGADGQWFRHPESNKIWTNYTLCWTTDEKRLAKRKIHENEKKCLQKIKQDPASNKKGLYCSRNWDGWLCWEDTSAGTLASQGCPNYFSDLNPTEKATKYCTEDGEWFRHPESNMTWTNYTLCVGNNWEILRATAQFSRDAEVELISEATESPEVQQKDREIVRKKILDNQYKCFEKMNRDLPYNKSGLYCSRNWDGWLCWEDTPAGTYTSQNCPNYFDDFDPTEKATKYCGEDGQWFRHPDTNRTWSNYTLCNENTKAKLKGVKNRKSRAEAQHGHCYDGKKDS